MQTSSTPLHHRLTHEAYLTPRWAVAGLCLGWPADASGPIWDPAAGGDSGYTVGEMLAVRTGAACVLTDIRETGHPGVSRADFLAMSADVPGAVVATNPPYAELDRWLDHARDLVGEGGLVAFLVPCLYLSSWGALPSGRSRWHGLRRIVRLCGHRDPQTGRNASGRVAFEMTREEAILRVAVNRRWFARAPGPQELHAEAQEYLSSPAGGWVEAMDPPRRPLAVVALQGSTTGYGLGTPATDHCWAIWYGGQDCRRPEDPPVRVTREECEQLLDQQYGGR